MPVLLALAVLPAGAQEDGRPRALPLPETQDPVARTLQRVVLDGRHPHLRRPELSRHLEEVRGVYEPRGWTFLWLGPGLDARPAVEEALGVLEAAPERGLEPEAYDLAWLREECLRLSAGELTPPEAALLDAGLTVALLRHLSDLHTGRVDPSTLHVGFEVEPKRRAWGPILVEAVEAGRIREAVAAAEPDHAQYRRLKGALARYRRLASGVGASPVPEADGTLHPGEAWSGAPALGRYLALLGDLPATTDAGREGTLDSLLVRGIRDFQARHGLQVDGVVGPATLAALRVPLEHRVRQLELALERLRWLPGPTGRRAVVVNIPAFELWAFDGPADRPPALSMRVVVGRALRTQQTPVFQAEMEYLVFSPYWDIPWSITLNEVLPAVRRDPGYLRGQGMEVVPAGRTSPAPGNQEVDEAVLERIVSGELRVRQRPGPANSLGRVKFIFPNARNVYLHGTPATQLFELSRRDFSHGCVRVEDPAALARWVLASRPEWTETRIREAMTSGRPLRIDLDEPVPVMIFYTTAMVWPDGRVGFLEDIYGHDLHLDRALSEG